MTCYPLQMVFLQRADVHAHAVRLESALHIVDEIAAPVAGRVEFGVSQQLFQLCFCVVLAGRFAERGNGHTSRRFLLLAGGYGADMRD